MSAFNDRVIAEFRANGGIVSGFGNRVNLKSHPDATIEDGRQASTIDVTATELSGESYTAARREFDRMSASFEEYQRTAGSRVLPIFRLTPQ